jgi:hypothetical protein
VNNECNAILEWYIRRFWEAVNGVISLPVMFLNSSVSFSNILLIFYASITVFVFLDNSLLTIPGRPQLARELFTIIILL